MPALRSTRAAFAVRLAVVAAALALLTACVSNSDSPPADVSSSGAAGSGSAPAGSGSGTPSASATSETPTPTPTPTPTSPVHASLLESDGVTFGVGMPIIMRFDVPVVDPTAMQNAITVLVNGAPAGGSWYWFTAQEAHYRMQNYWPANSTVTMNAPLQGLSAGPGLSFDDSLTLDMPIGDAHISTVDANTLEMTVTDNGAVVNTIPVSLGAAATPTFNGTKVIMERDPIERMVGPGYDEEVPLSLRITNSGEFIHEADWNSRIGQASTSNGCTNLTQAGAQYMFDFSIVGDVVLYPNAPGPTMPSWDGYGDWNLDWSTWQGGGAL